MRPKPEEVLFFESAADFRRWLEGNHASRSEAWVGYYKKATGRGGLTYLQALDEALCFGWIDGQGCGLDEQSYTNRWTPRRPGSRWSEANINRMAELTAAGRMTPAGQSAFEGRAEAKPIEPGQYTFETRPGEMPDDLAAVFRQNGPAWEFFSRQSPGYRKSMTWYVVSAKQQPTRLRRLAALIGESAAGRRISEIATPRLSERKRDG